jgi:deazaflavin-dependent oxidoreductase (nitroreductase family)
MNPTQLRFPGQAAAPDGPIDLASMFVMHRALRRDLDLFTAAVAVVPAAQHRTWRRLATRWGLFMRTLRAHHTAEDATIWPALRERAPETRPVLDEIEAEHGRIDPLLAACEAGLAGMAAGTGDRAALAGDLDALARALRDHLDHVESGALPLVQAHLDPAAWAELEREIGRHHPARDAVAVLGWVLDGLPREHWHRLPDTGGAVLRIGALLQRRFARQERRTFRLVLEPGRRTGSDRALRVVSRVFMAAHTTLVRRSGGRLGTRVRGGDLLLLDVVGRRTGRTFTVPLLHIRDGDDLVVAASNGGIDHEPQWWRNLQAGPNAVVEVGGRRVPVTASEVEGPEREELWGRLNAMLAAYDGYQAGVRRRIAVVRLRPVVNAAPAGRPTADALAEAQDRTTGLRRA